MIAWLEGEVREVSPEGSLVLAAHGVGYEVFVPLGLLAEAREGARMQLAVHTHVREDQITLFGFRNARERAMFRRLLGVAGVGAKTALALLSAIPLERLAEAIERGDAAAIARAPGIGRKTAQRIVVELKGKLAEAAPPGPHDEVRSALLNLGYKPAEVDRALTAATGEDFEALLKSALRELAR